MNEINDPERFSDLSPDEQNTLLNWIRRNLVKIKTVNRNHTSYGIKHLFEHDCGGFYISNGQMKGALLICGFEPSNRSDLNWCCRISQKSINALQKRGLRAV